MWKDSSEKMRKFRNEVNHLFDIFWNPSEFRERALSDIKKDIRLFRKPLSDLKETDKKIIANIKLPGINKKDIQLQVTENNLELKVEKKQVVKVEKKGRLRAERSHKGFYRAISLPIKINSVSGG